jgi:hypothetical protein
MPNTQVKLIDDLKIWAIALCDRCKVKGYIHFLVNSNKRTIKFLKWTAFLFIVGCIGLALSKIFPEKNPITGMMSNVVTMICTLAALFGVLAIPISIIKYISNSTKLRKTRNLKEFSVKNIGDAFKGEAERIWEELDQGSTEKVWGEFELPKYKSLEEYDNIAEKTLKAIKGIKGNKPERVREVFYAAKTVDELKSILPNELKRILQEPH